MVLTSFASDGRRQSDIVLVTVHHPLLESPPVFSSTIAVETDYVWTVFEEGGLLSRIALSERTLTEIDVCTYPRTLALTEKTVGVACQTPAQLVLVDKTDLSITRIDLPENSAPYGVAAQNDSWWLTLSATGQIASYRNGTLELIDIAPDLRGISILSDDAIATTRWRSPAEGGEVHIWRDQEHSKIDIAIDFNGDSDNTTGGIPNLLEVPVPSPDGRSLVIPMLHTNTLRGLYQNGQWQSHETSLRAILASISLEDDTEAANDRKHFDERGRASAAVFSPLGNYLFVLHPSTGHITIMDSYNQQIIGSISNIGNMPTGLAISPDGETLLVYVWLDRQVQAYDLQEISTPTLLWSTSIRTEEPLSENILQGKRIFHDAKDQRITRSGYISCSNCHPDGAHDGQTWDFTQRGEGLRNTTSLLGQGGLDMGLLHWSGNFDEIQDFEEDLRLYFAGTGFMDDQDFAQTNQSLGEKKQGLSAELDSLAEYVSSLDQSLRSPYLGNDSGAQSFVEEGCIDCHSPPLYTDSNLLSPIRHDVGTITQASGGRQGVELDGLDTPTLLGVWNTPPYLHDGSAKDISGAILAHDQYQSLEEEILISIAQYVKSL